MTRHTRLVSGAAVLAALTCAGCEGGGAAKDGNKPKSTAAAKTTAKAKTTATAATKTAGDKPADTGKPAEAAPKNVAADFFTGEPPGEVKLITGYVEDYPSYDFAIKTPDGWSGAGQQGWGYMAMRKDQTAAVFCDIMGNDESLKLGAYVGIKEITTLAKRAPAKGKDLEPVGEEATAKVGKLAYPARVGHATAHLFGEDGGDVFWIDIRHEQKEGPWHMYCVMTIKKSAGADVRTEAKAVMRSIEPPRGKKVLEPKASPG